MSRGERSRPTGERTAEDRRREREARERRRAGISESSAPESQPTPEIPPVPEAEPVPEAPPTPETPVAPEIPAAPETTPVPGDAPHTSIAAEPSRPAREHELAYAPGLAPVADELPLPIVTPPVEHTRVLAPPPPLPPELGGQPAPRRRRASLPARLAAVVMLVVVVAAVGLLAHSLSRSATHTKTIAPPLEVKVLIPEGKTRAQIAEIAAEDRLVGSYGAASKRSPLLDPARYGAPAHTDSLEGFLFPATYDMDAGAPASRLVEEQLVAFRENFGATEVERAHDLHVTPYQLLTVASMVEREAQVPGDRAKIAAVIYNRLHAGMPLGIDATIYYAVELQRGIATYTHELTEAQLHIDSPYNTRIHTGLPPTPISNPGDASIHAAAYPAHVSYLYYVAGADGCGEQVFSNTLAEFEVNVAAYHAALSKHGGRPPTCKHK